MKYAEARMTDQFFPLWQVDIYANWNLGDEITDRGELVTIRLFHLKVNAEIFANVLNNTLSMITALDHVEN